MQRTKRCTELSRVNGWGAPDNRRCTSEQKSTSNRAVWRVESSKRLASDQAVLIGHGPVCLIGPSPRLKLFLGAPEITVVHPCLSLCGAHFTIMGSPSTTPLAQLLGTEVPSDRPNSLCPGLYQPKSGL